jgi:two-component system chemotaxis response regulator CheY
MVDALVIDDNRGLADVFCSMLGILGISARPVYDARTGILALEKSAPDVVFLDINMPEVDGMVVLSYIRRTPGCEELPVVMVTSNDQIEMINRAKEMGATSYIVKPVNIDLLERSLQDIGLLPK